ncbi:MAG: divergent PAP2 family protein [Chloroflexota bacterium]|nr:MAG: divergent PAP2 family protein [Chloroflexota bacterium]
MSELLGNRVLQASVIAWASAQILKFFIDLLWRRKVNFRALTTMGGMPSSHSAAVSSLATGIAIVDGLGSTIFALALWFAAVTMYDAAGIRRAAMMQAKILNQMIEELFQGHPISDVKLRELLGHTPVEVIVGMLLGIVIALWWMTR